MTIADIKNPYIGTHFSHILTLENVKPTANIIIRYVCKVMNVSEEEVKQLRNRNPAYVLPRQMCWKLIREYKLPMNLIKIGNKFGGFDHSTVLFGIQSITNRISTDKEVEAMYKTIKAKIKINTAI